MAVERDPLVLLGVQFFVPDCVLGFGLLYGYQTTDVWILAAEAKDMRERDAILIDQRKATRLFHQSVIFQHSLFIIVKSHLVHRPRSLG